MPSVKTENRRSAMKAAGQSRGSRTLGLAGGDAIQVVSQIRAGFAFSRLAKFQKATQLPWEKVARVVGIPPRTLARRQSQGRLRPDESDRVFRAARVFELAVGLFEGDVAGARQWLQMPQPGLAGQAPLDFASTDVGAREIENLIGRLEHGVVG